MKDAHLASSYRRLFRILTKDMPNWKEKIIIVFDSDDMPHSTNDARIQRIVKRMGRIKRAVEFMVGGPSTVKLYDNGAGSGKTIVLRNAGYYKNIGA